MSIADTTEVQFDHHVSGNPRTLLDFWRPSCGPCKALNPHLAALGTKFEGHLGILKINIDDEPALARRFQVRSVPTLVLLNDAQEEGRLVGTSTVRLNAMVEKWLGDVPVGAPDAVPAPASPAPQATARAWSSFFGRAELRDACVARVREIPDVAGVRPSPLMARTLEQFESELGIPLLCAPIFDFVWYESRAFNFKHYEALHAQFVALIAAIPLGADLFALTLQLRFDMLYRSEWAIAPYLEGADALSVLDAIRAAHQREIDGEATDDTQWEALRKRAALLAGIDGARESESRTLEAIAIPLATQKWEAALNAVMALYYDDVRREPHWSPDDVARISALDSQLQALIRETLGAIPAPGDALVDWARKQAAIRTKWSADQRAADLTLWARRDAHLNVIKEARRAMIDFLYEQMLSRFAAATEA